MTTGFLLFSVISSEYLRETAYGMLELLNYVQENETRLLTDQLTAYNRILGSVEENTGRIFFLDAPGGTGKTFLINLLLAQIRSRKKIALAVASSGIAATLMQGGRTAHSAFKLPLNLEYAQNPVCNIKKGTYMSKVLQSCSIIFWDECTMSHKGGIEALNRTLQDIRNSDKLMGDNGDIVLSGIFVKLYL